MIKHIIINNFFCNFSLVHITQAVFVIFLLEAVNLFFNQSGFSSSEVLGFSNQNYKNSISLLNNCVFVLQNKPIK
jgi:hypothetical protein